MLDGSSRSYRIQGWSDLRHHVGQLLSCLLISAAVGPAYGQVPDDFHPPVVILYSEGGDATLIKDRVLTTLWFTTQEMNIPLEDVPPIVIIRAQSAVARQVGITPGKNGALLAIGTPGTKGLLFELWIVGDDLDLALTKGFVQALSVQREIDEKTQQGIAQRVAKRIPAKRTVFGAFTLQPARQESARVTRISK
jgi:hypothetical protein